MPGSSPANTATKAARAVRNQLSSAAGSSPRCWPAITSARSGPRAASCAVWRRNFPGPGRGERGGLVKVGQVADLVPDRPARRRSRPLPVRAGQPGQHRIDDRGLGGQVRQQAGERLGSIRASSVPVTRPPRQSAAGPRGLSSPVQTGLSGSQPAAQGWTRLRNAIAIRRLLTPLLCEIADYACVAVLGAEMLAEHISARSGVRIRRDPRRPHGRGQPSSPALARILRRVPLPEPFGPDQPAGHLHD